MLPAPMTKKFITELQKLGLSQIEAQSYLALVNHGPLGATAIANLIGIPRSSVYPTLCSLTDKALIEAGAGYGTKFAAVPPAKALPSLIVREKQTLAKREQLADQLVELMAAMVPSQEIIPDELIQVLRNPQVVAERFDRLQLEAKRQIDSFIKAPFFCRLSNPAQEEAQRRGVRVRSIYEQAALQDGAVEPYLAAWVAAGEQARVYHGELPQKLAIFDNQCVLMPLMLPGDQMRALVISHPQLTQTLSMFFESLWKKAEPITPANGRNAPRRAAARRQETPQGSLNR